MSLKKTITRARIVVPEAAADTTYKIEVPAWETVLPCGLTVHLHRRIAYSRPWGSHSPPRLGRIWVATEPQTGLSVYTAHSTHSQNTRAAICARAEERLVRAGRDNITELVILNLAKESETVIVGRLDGKGFTPYAASPFQFAEQV